MVRTAPHNSFSRSVGSVTGNEKGCIMPIIGYELGKPLTAAMVLPSDSEDRLEVIISDQESQEDTVKALMDGAVNADRYLNGDVEVEELDEEECMLPGECHRIRLHLHEVKNSPLPGASHQGDRGADRAATR